MQRLTLPLSEYLCVCVCVCEYASMSYVCHAVRCSPYFPSCIQQIARLLILFCLPSSIIICSEIVKTIEATGAMGMHHEGYGPGG